MQYQPFQPLPGSLLVEGKEDILEFRRGACGSWGRRLDVKDTTMQLFRADRPRELQHFLDTHEAWGDVWARCGPEIPRHWHLVGFCSQDGRQFLPTGALGLLRPDGLFFPCGHGRHRLLADVIDPDGGVDALLARGWCRVTAEGPEWGVAHETSDAQWAWLSQKKVV